MRSTIAEGWELTDEHGQPAHDVLLRNTDTLELYSGGDVTPEGLLACDFAELLVNTSQTIKPLGYYLLALFLGHPRTSSHQR